MLVLGLTGSIGMGKSTTATMFADCGVPVHDADMVVHDLYRGAAVEPVGKMFEGVVRDGVVDRERLAALITGRPDRLKALEAIVHPMVQRAETALKERARRAGRRLIILDIPLLFETGAENRCDAVLTVSAPASVQRERVLARPGMTEAKFQALLQRQWSDGDKRQSSHFVVDTASGLDSARRQVDDIIAACSMVNR